jgi:hypothetical protein
VRNVADRLRAHAAALTDDELRRRGSILASLPPERRAAVEALARSVAALVADSVVADARATPALAAALSSIYGTRGCMVGESAVGTAD